MKLPSLLIWISTVSGWSIEFTHRHSVNTANSDACRSVQIVNKWVYVWRFCLLEGPTGTYGRVWEGSSPAPQSRITHLTRLNVDSFVFHKVLGKGSFGKVHIWDAYGLKENPKIQGSSVIFHLLPFWTGSPGRAEGSWRVLCSEGSEKRCGSDGRWCGVHYGGEESPGFSLGKPLPHAPFLHISDQGSRSAVAHL